MSDVTAYIGLGSNLVDPAGQALIPATAPGVALPPYIPVGRRAAQDLRCAGRTSAAKAMDGRERLHPCTSPAAMVHAGLAALASLPQTKVEACSSLYTSAPVGLTNQPDFVNAACRVRTTLPALTLMQALLDIERQHGRVRDAAKGGPRTLDLDLLLYGDLILNDPDLTLPHPRLHERAFVLRPLCELDAGLVIPGYGRAVDLLVACVGQRVEWLERC